MKFTTSVFLFVSTATCFGFTINNIPLSTIISEDSSHNKTELVPAQFPGPKRMHFMDINTGIIEMVNGQIIKTSDLGNEWRLIQKQEHSLNFSRQIDFATALAVGDSGFSLLSYDGATAWKKLGYSTTLNLNAINMKTWSRNILVGDSGLILAGDLGYDSIGKMPFPGKDNLTYVIFFDENIGIVASSDKIFQTRNAGAIWTTITPNLKKGTYQFSPSSLAFTDTNSAYLTTYDSAHSSAHVYRTEDGGQNWRSVYSDSTGNHPGFMSLSFKSSTCGIIGGKQNKGMYTTNGGQTWTPLTAYLVDFNNNSDALIYATNKLEINFIDENICDGLNHTRPNIPPHHRFSVNFESDNLFIHIDHNKSPLADLRLYNMKGKLIAEKLNASIGEVYRWRLPATANAHATNFFLVAVSLKGGETLKGLIVKMP